MHPTPEDLKCQTLRGVALYAVGLEYFIHGRERVMQKNPNDQATEVDDPQSLTLLFKRGLYRTTKYRFELDHLTEEVAKRIKRDPLVSGIFEVNKNHLIIVGKGGCIQLKTEDLRAVITERVIEEKQPNEAERKRSQSTG